MANLTALEIVQILNPGIEPKPDATDLLTLVKISAFIKGHEFNANLKDTTGNEPAEKYKNKVAGVIRLTFNNNEATLKSLETLLIIILATKNYTFQQITDATDEQWQTFILETIIEAMEYLSGVLAAEKSAYDNI